MATYEFTYKVPDTLWVNSWADGTTATGKVKSDTPIIKCWIARGGPEAFLLASSFDGVNSADSARNVNPIIGGPAADDYQIPGYTVEERTIDLSTASDALKMAAHALKGNAATVNWDDEEDVPRTYTETAVPVFTSGRTYNDMDNPQPQDIWTIDLNSWDSDGFVDFEAVTKSDLNQAELDAVWRREEVKHYINKYDLGAAGDSDANAFIAACNSYLTTWGPAKPWMDDGTFNDSMSAPRIPLSVISALGVMKASGADVELFKADAAFRAQASSSIAELDKGDDVVLLSSL